MRRVGMMLAIKIVAVMEETRREMTVEAGLSAETRLESRVTRGRDGFGAEAQ
jgi:hypothetical protein